MTGRGHEHVQRPEPTVSRRYYQAAGIARHYLRAIPEAARAYAEQKKRLVANGNVTLLAYLAAKAPIVEELIRKSLSATL